MEKIKNHIKERWERDSFGCIFSTIMGVGSLIFLFLESPAFLGTMTFGGLALGIWFDDDDSFWNSPD